MSNVILFILIHFGLKGENLRDLGEEISRIQGIFTFKKDHKFVVVGLLISWSGFAKDYADYHLSL